MILGNILGLIALISVVASIVIYLIKQPFQNKVVNSSYLWKESQKFKKKRPTASKLRHIVMLICQIIALAAASFIIAMPYVEVEATGTTDETIIIIDGSANMLASDGESTRFERAVEKASELSATAIGNNENVSIIIANETASYVVLRQTSSETITSMLDNLVIEGDMKCSYGDGDIAGAMTLANDINDQTTMTEIYMLTATEYAEVGEIEVIDVSAEDDWNMSILNVAKEVVDNYWQFTLTVGVYGQSEAVVIDMNAYGVNDDSTEVSSDESLNCSDSSIYTVVFKDHGVYEYDSVVFTISSYEGNQDSFSYDNEYILYGGRAEVIDILYCSTAENKFFTTILSAYASAYKDDYSIQTVYSDDPTENLSGFDFYIFEHSMPAFVPTDGFVLMVNPNIMPTNVDVVLSNTVTGDFTLDSSTMHSILSYVSPSSIEVSSYTQVSNSTGFTSLMHCNGDSVFLIKDEVDCKQAVISFSLNYSNLAMLLDFPLLMKNMFDYYFPQTLSGYCYDAGSSVPVSARGSSVELKYGEEVTSINATDSVVCDNLGVYTVEQTLISGETKSDSFFVKVSASQSDFTAFVSELPNLFDIEQPPLSYMDLLLWLSIVLCAAIFIERILNSIEQI